MNLKLSHNKNLDSIIRKFYAKHIYVKNAQIIRLLYEYFEFNLN
jgi:hypothetical protein